MLKLWLEEIECWTGDLIDLNFGIQFYLIYIGSKIDWQTKREKFKAILLYYFKMNKNSMKYSSFISKINSITHLNNELKRTIAINVVLCPDIHCLTL